MHVIWSFFIHWHKFGTSSSSILPLRIYDTDIWLCSPCWVYIEYLKLKVKSRILCVFRYTKQHSVKFFLIYRALNMWIFLVIVIVFGGFKQFELVWYLGFCFCTRSWILDFVSALGVGFWILFLQKMAISHRCSTKVL